jgi:hypothetical protein
MIRRGSVYVRAQDPEGKWGSHDVLDLTEESFRAFICGQLIKHGLLHYIAVDKGQVIALQSRVAEYDDAYDE